MTDNEESGNRESDENNFNANINTNAIPLKHPLEYPWTFSYKPKIAYKQQSERDWLLDYKKISTISDIECFWGVYNNVPSLTDMPSGSIYSIFKNDIHPSWEHTENKDGFSWIFYGSKNANKEWIHKMYENTMLMLIGCMYDYEELLNGCTFEKKAKGDKFAYWFKGNGGNSELDILNKLIEHIDLTKDEYVITDDHTKIDWKLNEFKHKKVCIKLVKHKEESEIASSTPSYKNSKQSNSHSHTHSHSHSNNGSRSHSHSNNGSRSYSNSRSNNESRSNKSYYSRNKK